MSSNFIELGHPGRKKSSSSRIQRTSFELLTLHKIYTSVYSFGIMDGLQESRPAQ